MALSDLRRRRFLSQFAVCCSMAILGAAVAGERPGAPVVAAASSLNPALTEVAEAFFNGYGEQVRLSFGASGNIARQLMHGAPYQVFLSADEQAVRALSERALTLGDGDVYALGQLALFVPRGSALGDGASFQDLRTAAADGRLRRLAIANPEHAPYGRAARQLLQSAGLWDRLGGKLVIGENVAQAMQFAASGAVDAGIVSYSSTMRPGLAERGRTVALPPEGYDRPRHRMVLMRQAGPVASRFYAFMTTAAARSILERHGFARP